MHCSRRRASTPRSSRTLVGGLPDHRPVFDVVPGFSVDPIRRPAPPNRRFSPEARNGLAARYNAGEDTAELAAEYGVSVQRMNALLLSSPVYCPRRRKRVA